MKRHQSLDENRQRCSLDHRNHPITLSSRSLDRYLDDKKKQMAVKNEGKVLETMDIVDPEAAFQAELLEEATQTLLHLSQCASSSPSLSRKGQGCIFLCILLYKRSGMN